MSRAIGGGSGGGGDGGLAMVAWQGWSSAPQVSMDQVRGVWTSQDRRPEEHTKASESAMVVMD
jgi:hypothetical protein